MKYFILAGEASGDLHSAALATALKQVDPDAKIAGWGGDEMTAAGVQVMKHYRELAFMGFVEVVKHLPEIMRNFRLAKDQIAALKPDALILTDYPGFNLRMAKWAKQRGIPVHYYISPQLWAWKESRVKKVRRDVDHMYVILPFEEPFYQKHNYPVHYVGHPLAWRIAQLPKKEPLPGKKRITLLPGSRKREIAYMLPVMLDAVKELHGYDIYVAGAPSVSPEYYYNFIAKSGIKGITLTFGYTYTLLQRSSAAVCTSGTATLETALFGVPQVVCYKGDRLSYLIAKRLIRVPYIAMVNLISGKEVVRELIQDDFNPENVRKEVIRLLLPETQERIRAGYAEITMKLATTDPGMTVAKRIFASLKKP